MPMYEFRCLTCGNPVVSDDRVNGPDACHPSCGATEGFKRVYSFQMAPVMHSHLNSTTGTVISDRRGFKDALARKSDEMTERTGMPHNYVEVAPGDTTGVTDEGLKESFDKRKARREIDPDTTAAAWTPA